MSRTLDEIRARWANATPGPWKAGGPVTREALLRAAPSGLSAEVYEIGHNSDHFPPALAVVNDYCVPHPLRGPKVLDRERWTAADNAQAIAHAPEDVAWLLAEVERLRALLARRTAAR